MKPDGLRWDDKYAKAQQPDPRMPEAIDGHEELLALIPSDGLAVDVACGTGAQSLWLAHRGLRVVSLDASPVGIELLAQAAQAAELGSRIDARVIDLEAGLPPDVGFVDLLLCQRFRDPTLYDTFVRVLRPGGVGIVTVLSPIGLDRDPGRFHAPPGELSNAFDRPDVRVLLDVEDAGVATVVFQRP